MVTVWGGELLEVVGDGLFADVREGVTGGATGATHVQPGGGGNICI